MLLPEPLPDLRGPEARGCPSSSTMKASSSGNVRFRISIMVNFAILQVNDGNPENVHAAPTARRKRHSNPADRMRRNARLKTCPLSSLPPTGNAGEGRYRVRKMSPFAYGERFPQQGFDKVKSL